MLGRTLYGRGNGHAFIRQLSPAAWFRFNTGITVTGSGVSQWDDQSGNARHLKQGTDANRPSKVNATGSVAVGSGSSFTRATVATVTDFEGNVRNCVSGEVRFQNARRVHNLIPTSSATIAVGGNKTVAVGVGVYVFSMGAEPTGTSVITFTGTATGSTGTLTADASSRTAKTLTITGAGTIIATCTVADALEVQLENVTGQSNQNPSEYVSVGAAKLNDLLQTENLSTAPWGVSGATAVYTPTVMSPHGAATLVTPTGAGGCAVQTVTFTRAAGTALGASVDYKDNGLGGVALFIYDSAGVDYVQAEFNLTAGTTIGAGGYNTTARSASISALGNGWYRCTVNGTFTNAGTAHFIQIREAVGFPFNGSGVYATAVDFTVNAAVRPIGAYFPVGNVYPYHGACVDGVAYFDYLNPNVVE